MAKRMLIDATHREETRVVVLDGNRLEEFDFESSTKQQLKGNIYLAKVTRVEPSLQAAFVEYGGNRHGFLAFNEIHPDYYRIPVADREALIAEVANEREPETEPEAESEPHAETRSESEAGESRALLEIEPRDEHVVAQEVTQGGEHDAEGEEHSAAAEAGAEALESDGAGSESAVEGEEAPAPGGSVIEVHAEPQQVETLGGDEVDEAPPRRHRGHRHYKIQ